MVLGHIRDMVLGLIRDMVLGHIRDMVLRAHPGTPRGNDEPAH
jgi:hypothetical protein